MNSKIEIVEGEPSRSEPKPSDSSVKSEPSDSSMALHTPPKTFKPKRELAKFASNESKFSEPGSVGVASPKTPSSIGYCVSPLAVSGKDEAETCVTPKKGDSTLLADGPATPDCQVPDSSTPGAPKKKQKLAIFNNSPTKLKCQDAEHQSEFDELMVEAYQEWVELRDRNSTFAAPSPKLSEFQRDDLKKNGWAVKRQMGNTFFWGKNP